MAKRRKPKTAAEIIAELQQDPGWVQRNQAREERARAQEAELTLDEQPIVADLACAGIPVSSVWDLVNSSASYAAATPVLCKHLRGLYHPKTLEGIARALTVREARGDGARVIIGELERRRSDVQAELRWALANALTVTADETVATDLQSMVDRSEHEDVRALLKAALRVSRGSRSRCWSQPRAASRPAARSQDAPAPEPPFATPAATTWSRRSPPR